MSTPDLSAKLPPPHDEEPAQLRSDILDELQDHLSCAADRERRRLQLNDQPTDQANVWTAVIERFGDPSALARRLWFDAMKGRLMTQRILLGAVIVLTAWMGLILVGNWRMTGALAILVIENQKATAAILDRLEKLARATPTASPEWIAVKYRLVQGTSGGPPVVGQKVYLKQNSVTQNTVSRLSEISEVTNSDGIADFGNLPYGTYTMWIETPAWRFDDIITMRPGRSFDQRIVVPREPEMAEVKFEFSPPDMTIWKWEDQPPVGNLTPCLHVYCAPTREIQVDGKAWNGTPLVREFLVTPNGIFHEKQEPKVPMVVAGPGARDVVTEPGERETVQLPAIEMSIQADWYYPSGLNEKGETVPSGSNDSQVYHSVSRKLNEAFVRESQGKAKEALLPLIITPERGTSPNVIRFPSDHPDLF